MHRINALNTQPVKHANQDRKHVPEAQFVKEIPRFEPWRSAHLAWSTLPWSLCMGRFSNPAKLHLRMPIPAFASCRKHLREKARVLILTSSAVVGKIYIPVRLYLWNLDSCNFPAAVPDRANVPCDSTSLNLPERRRKPRLALSCPALRQHDWRNTEWVASNISNHGM